MKTRNEVRFHLQAGRNYMKWQVKVVRGGRKVEVRYFDPAEHRLELRGCRLVNKINKAKKVHEAGVKDVSGWIECEEVLTSDLPVEGLERLFLQPDSGCKMEKGRRRGTVRLGRHRVRDPRDRGASGLHPGGARWLP